MADDLKSTQNKLSELRKDFDRFKIEIKRMVEGFGVMVLHGTRLDVDVSVKISELLGSINNLSDRIDYIESITGSESSPSTTTAVEEFKIGNFRLYAPRDTPYRGEVHSGNTLYLEYDNNEGKTTEPDWDIRERNIA